jgi:hypothetical protein
MQDPHLMNESQDDREKALRQDGLLIGIAVVSMLNGMHFSPWVNLFAAALAPLLAAFFITSPVLLFYFASLTLAVGTAILAGVPAAIYEQAKGLGESNGVSLGIWLVTTMALTIPTVIAFFTGT